MDAIHTSIKYGSINVFNILSNIDILTISNNKYTTILRAVSMSNIYITATLLKNKKSKYIINNKDSYGRNAISLALLNNDHNMIKLLLKHRFLNINSQLSELYKIDNRLLRLNVKYFKTNKRYYDKRF